jgi:hypothetical protein
MLMFAGLPGGSNGGMPASAGGCLFVVIVTALVMAGMVALLVHAANMIP